MSTTAGELAERLVVGTVGIVEAARAEHLPGWRIPRTFAGHLVTADVRADLCFTLHHLAEAGVTSVAGEAIDDVLRILLAEVDGSSTHTFFSYRIAEVLARHGTLAGNPLTEGFTDEQVRQLEVAVDSSDWLELLDAKVLPRNYAAVLSRCELGRVSLGLVAEGDSRLDDLVGRVHALLTENPRFALDDSQDRNGRYDIYSADVWLFCEPLASRIGPVWDEGLAFALDLVRSVGGRRGTSIPWGRSTGDLSAAVTLELAALALSTGVAGDDAGLWLRRAADATDALLAGFDPDGVADAHRHRAQDSYRGPERRLQLTFDVLGKIAWAAGALQRVDPSLAAAPIAAAYPLGDRWIPFEDGRPSGAWAHRSRGADVVVPFVGITRSHYLPAVHQPGAFEVPIDRDLPTWTPLVLAGVGRYTAGGLPASIEHATGETPSLTATWDGFKVSGRGLDGDDPGPPLAGTRTARLSIDRRTIVLDDHLTFEQPPHAVTIGIPEVADRPLAVEWTVEATSGAPDGIERFGASTVTVDGLAEWRSPWSEIAKVHQLDLDPATELRYRARVTPLLRVASTAFGHHYHESLYRPMAHRVVDRPTPVGWDAVPDPGFHHLDLLHVHWPEWVAFDDLDAHRRILDELAEHAVPTVWTAHNLTPHEKRADTYDPIYAAWAASVDSVIHHSAWGEQLIRERYEFRPDCRHEVIPHGHFGGLWAAAGLPDRATAETWLGLAPTPLRIGIVGAPRAEKLVQVVLDAVAACGRDDVQLVCWSLGRDEVVPDDPRIVIADRYRMVDPAAYAIRLAACDVLVLVFDPDGEMLATGAAADAVGLGLPVLRSEWGYLVETLGDAGIASGHTVESVAAAIDGLSPERLAAARTAAADRKVALDWVGLAERTADLFERTVLAEP